MSATLRDVARKTGVSLATVSRVLNGSSHPVNEETRQRVLKVAAQLGYRPNRLAVGLKKNRSAALGFVVPGLMGGPFYSMLYHGIEAVANAKGYGILVTTTVGRGTNEERALNMLLERQVEGLIALPSSDAVELYGEVVEQAPLVFLDRYIDGVVADRVTSDDVRGGYLVTRHLINLGHRRIAFITGPEHPVTSTLNRLAGYERALNEAGIEFRKVITTDRDFEHTIRTGYSAAMHLFSNRENVTAVVAINDMVAMGVLQACWENGVEVPGELAVTGYSDTEFGQYLTPPLTSIQQDAYRMGELAAEILFKRLAGDKSPTCQVVVEPQLVVRQSCGCRQTV